MVLKGSLRGKLVLILTLVALATSVACTRKPGPLPTPTTVPLEALPENNAAVLLRSADGGTVALRDGAQITVPPEVLSDASLVTLRALNSVPPTPVPLSVIGRVYDVSLEGGALDGIATMLLPLPPNVTPDQYDLGAYRWDGKAWQRTEGRVDGEQIHLGIDGPGTYAVLGDWRGASATLDLTVPTTEPGQTPIRIDASGQYRYSVLPTTQHDYVVAHLTLKRDSSGGAGQVSGIDQLDQTVAETVLWFKPDPTQSQGVVDFKHTFEIDPTGINAPLGSPSMFYGVLTVDDSPAPTRRFSTGTDYTLQVPIMAVGTDIVRPEMPNNKQPLMWNVRLNGQTLFQRPAGTTTFSLAEALAQGGLGEYKVTLDAEYQGRYVPISNEITVQLAVPPTPAAVAQAPGGTPTPTPFSFGTMPPTPTRRAPPVGTPSALEGPGVPIAATFTPAISPTPTPTPTPTRTGTSSLFWSDQDLVAKGQCTTLHWNVENVTAVYFENNPTVGNSTRQVCPTDTTTYTLRVVDDQSKTQEYHVVVSIDAGGGVDNISFTADDLQVVKGNCTTLHWRATDVLAVFLDDQGVSGEDTKEVCPTDTTTYTLRVQGNDTETSRRLTVWVLPEDSIVMHFWADQYTLSSGECTNINWEVENVDTVSLHMNGTDSGVTGFDSRQVCPSGQQTYTLTATKGDHSTHKDVVVQSGNMSVGRDEVLAQGTVTEVVEVTDLDSTTAGDLNGFRVVIDGVDPLAEGSSSDCCESRMTLRIAKSLLDQAPDRIDWPVRAGQSVEFRLGPCTSNACTVYNWRSSSYFKLRSQ